MLEIYYATAFGISVMLMLIYVFTYHKHYDMHISIVFVLVPISNLAQLIVSQSENLEAVLVATRFLYISACYLILMITLAVFSICNIKLNRYIKLLLYSVTTVVFIFSQQIGRNQLYYKSTYLIHDIGGVVLVKEYGGLHTVYYVMVIMYFVIGMAAIIYSFIKNNQVSNRFICLLALPEIISFISFFGGRKIASQFLNNAELIPAVYDISLIIYLIITRKLVLYNISDTIIDSIVQKGDKGFISFDFKFRYLGSNQTAREIFPDLNTLAVDKPVPKKFTNIVKWLYDFSIDNTSDKVYYKRDEATYLINISYLSDGRRKCGYQMYITDDTKNQQYIALLDSFNTELKAEVAQKTKHIVEMHDNLIMSMAMMVESRDNSTGGHIRRTSECVRILVDEIQKGDDFDLSEKFCHDIIKAAPMHDLGKITVDDAILRKPGRFTDEEFEVMKTHAAEGAKIVHEILKGTDDGEFRVLAENVAHYHHERWDGSGYPEKLRGENIPLEARIMAVADVYDALVSKRVYKEKMSFEKADNIIMEGMGKHFDKKLEPYYISARPRLEQYYKSLE